jgi:hypothetical protein
VEERKKKEKEKKKTAVRIPTSEEQHYMQNKSNPHTDSPPFLTRQSHERFTLLRVAAV